MKVHFCFYFFLEFTTFDIDENFNHEIILLLKIGGEHEIDNKKFPLEVILILDLI